MYEFIKLVLMPDAAATTDTYIAFVQEISDRRASFVGPLPHIEEGHLIEIHITGHYTRKARIVGYFPGGYRLDFIERIHGDPPPPSAITGALTLARVLVRNAPKNHSTVRY